MCLYVTYSNDPYKRRWNSTKYITRILTLKLQVMAKKLSEIIKTKKGVDLKFIDLQQDETQDGDPILILTLETPLDLVIGSTRLNNRGTGDSIRTQATDVEFVSIGKSTLTDIDTLEDAGEVVIEWEEEGKSGRIKSDKLFLDVAKRDYAVWITSVKFAEYGRQIRDAQTAKKFDALADKVKKGNVRKEFRDVDPEKVAEGKNKPEVVAE